MILLRSEEAKLCLFTTGDQRPKLETTPKETLYHLTKRTLIFITERQEGGPTGRVTKETTEREKAGYYFKTAGSTRDETSRWQSKAGVTDICGGDEKNMKSGKGEKGWIFQRLP